MGTLTLVDDPVAVRDMVASVDPDAFPQWNTHPLAGMFAIDLYGEINRESDAHHVAPLAVSDGDKALLFAMATCDGDTVSMFGLPLVMALHRETGKKRRKKVFAMAFEHLAALAARHGASSATILGAGGQAELGPTDLACIDRLGTPQSKIYAVTDTTHGEQGLHRDLRSSYRSLVNWGREQLQMHYINAENPDRSKFDSFPDFHAEVAGGSKRSTGYWEVYWNEIAAGRGELSLGYLEDGSLASGTLVIDAGATAYYASGVYDRSKFDKPLAHFPVFDAMVRAGARGRSMFDIGEIFPAGSTTEKEVQIGFFKKGFTSTFQLRTIWSVPLQVD